MEDWRSASDGEIRLINERFVPLIWGYGGSGYAKEEEFMKWRTYGRLENYFIGSKNNWYAVSAGGNPIPGGKEKSLEEILALWEKLPESERKPSVDNDRGRPSGFWASDVEPPAETLILRIHHRPLRRDSKGRYALINYDCAAMTFEGPQVTTPPDPVQDYLWITREEWKGLVSGDLKKGDRRVFPASACRRLGRFGFQNNFAIPAALFWPSEAARTLDLAAVVDEVSPSRVSFRLEGAVRLEHLQREYYDTKGDTGYEGVFVGAAHFDRKKNAFTRFDMVSVGDYWGIWWHGSLRPRTPMGYAFELIRETAPGYRTTPSGLHGHPEEYLAGTK